MAAPERVFNRNVPDAGLFRQRIGIEVPDPNPDELGQTDIAWVSTGTFWAQIVETQGREFLKGDYHNEERAVFIIRYQEVNSRARVVWGLRPDGQPKTWDITGITGTYSDGYRWLHCLATDGVN